MPQVHPRAGQNMPANTRVWNASALLPDRVVSDRLPAIRSVMQRTSNARGWNPIWGMWKNFLDKSMA